MTQLKLMQPMLAAFALFGRLAFCVRRVFGAACLSAVLVVSVVPAVPAVARSNSGFTDTPAVGEGITDAPTAIETDINKRLENGLTPIMHVIKERDFVAVGLLLGEEEIDLHLRTDKGEEVLHIAVLYAPEVIPQLVKAGADVNAGDGNLWTPLHYAAAEGKLDAVNALAKAGANLNARSNAGHTPLHAAISVGKGDFDGVIKAIAKAGADTNARDAEGLTPLDFAVHHNSAEGAAAMIAAGADTSSINDKDADGWTPLHRAAKENRHELASVLIRAGADIEARDNQKYTPLLSAAYWNSVDVARALLEAGANVRAVSNVAIHKTALSAAYVNSNDNSPIVRLIRIASADPNGRDHLGLTPLFKAIAGKQSKEDIRVLVKRGADVNATTHGDQSVLHFAAIYTPEAIPTLLKAGANPNVDDRNYWSPLHYAVSEGHLDAVKALIQGGANPHYRNNQRHTAYRIAKDKHGKGSQFSKILHDALHRTALPPRRHCGLIDYNCQQAQIRHYHRH